VSLSSRDRQALEAIEGELAESDQRLASMLAFFTRLVAAEAMPVRERGRGRGPAGQTRRPPRRRASGPCGQLLIALWVLISVVLIAVAAVISRGDASPCMVPGAAACAAHHGPHPHRT